MKKRAGFSLVELLITTSIMGLMLTMASQGIILALKFHRNQQEVVAAQSKLRRINDAISQEVRAAVLGGLANYPVTTNANGVSFLLLEGGAGYQVLNRTSSTLQFVADADTVAELGFATSQVLIVDSDGNALIVAVPAPTSLGNKIFQMTYPVCSNDIPQADNLLFPVKAVGYDYVKAENTLYRKDAGARVPIAFDITDFKIAYLPNLANVTQLAVTSEAQYHTVGNVTKKKTYSGQIALPQAASNFTRRIKDIKTCN
jgi:prepilin-type N-terminal cleavage/methylation domain-containing protein